MVVGNATIEKPREQWDEEERRRVQYNLKAKNISHKYDYIGFFEEKLVH